jgi:hypothetical protein
MSTLFLGKSVVGISDIEQYLSYLEVILTGRYADVESILPQICHYQYALEFINSTANGQNVELIAESYLPVYRIEHNIHLSVKEIKNHYQRIMLAEEYYYYH